MHSGTHLTAHSSIHFDRIKLFYRAIIGKKHVFLPERNRCGAHSTYIGRKRVLIVYTQLTGYIQIDGRRRRRLLASFLCSWTFLSTLNLNRRFRSLNRQISIRLLKIASIQHKTKLYRTLFGLVHMGWMVAFRFSIETSEEVKKKKKYTQRKKNGNIFPAVGSSILISFGRHADLSSVRQHKRAEINTCSECTTAHVRNMERILLLFSFSFFLSRHCHVRCANKITWIYHSHIEGVGWRSTLWVMCVVLCASVSDGAHIVAKAICMFCKRDSEVCFGTIECGTFNIYTSLN